MKAAVALYSHFCSLWIILWVITFSLKSVSAFEEYENSCGKRDKTAAKYVHFLKAEQWILGIRVKITRSSS